MIDVLIVADPTPSASLGLIEPLGALADQVRVRVVSPQRVLPADLLEVDLVAVSRRTSRAIVDFAQLRGVPLILDLDDNLLELPTLHTSPSQAFDAAVATLHQQYLVASATCVTVYTEAVRTAVAEVGGVPLLAPRSMGNRTPLRRRREQPAAERIVLPTPRADLSVTGRFTDEVLRAVLARRPEAEVHLWRPTRTFADHPRVVVHAAVPGRDRFLDELTALDASVGLAPLGTTPFERAKTDLKFRDLTACGIPGIYSSGTAYDNTVADGLTGLLVEADPGAWTCAVDRLLDEGGLWGRIQQAAVHDAERRFAFDDAADWWRTTIAGLHETRTRPSRPARLHSGVVRPDINASHADGPGEKLHYGAAIEGLLDRAPIPYAGVRVMRVRMDADLSTAFGGPESTVFDVFDAHDSLSVEGLAERVAKLGRPALLVAKPEFADRYRACSAALTRGAPTRGADLVLAEEDATTVNRTWLVAIGRAISLASRAYAAGRAPTRI